jgi:carbon-monoxide dehydrogenase medium subunit
MRPFAYARPSSLGEAIGLLAEDPTDARVLAGGTDLIIRLRDGTYRPSLVVDIKGVAELGPGIVEADDTLVIGAGTVMTDLIAHPVVRERFPALSDAARVVGSVQIRNRATLAGNLCNASPAADTAPPLLVYGARLRIVWADGEREVALDDFFVRSGVTQLAPGELVRSIVLPLPVTRVGSAFARRTRRRGHDLASVTLAATVDEAGTVRIAFGSLGPRPLVVTGRDDAGDALVERALALATPSPTSMRAGPEYRLAMLRLLAGRSLAAARDRLAAA